MLPYTHTLAFEADESGFADEVATPEQTDALSQDDAGGSAPPAFDYESPEFLDAVNQAADSRAEARLTELLEQAAQDYDDSQDFEEGDSRQAFRQMIRSELDSYRQEIAPTLEAFQEQQNQQQLDELIDRTPAIAEAQDLLPEGTDQHTDELAAKIAWSLVPDLAERYGGTQSPRAVQAALRQAGDMVLGYAKAQYQAGYQARNDELKGRSTAREPAPAAVETLGTLEEPMTPQAVAEAWAARRGFDE